MLDTVIRDPFREGRLRLDGTSGLERQLGIVGLVALGGLLMSVLLGGVWRGGGLTPLNETEGRWLFTPDTLLPVTLVALWVGWLVFMWGALRATLPFRLLGVALFLLLNGTLGKPVVAAIGDDLALRWGEPVVRAGYFAVPSLLVLYSLIAWSPRWAARLRPVFLMLLTAALGALYGAQLWIHVAQVRGGTPQTVPGFLHSAITDIAFALTPMVMLAAVALVEFSYGVGEALATPARAWAATTAKVVAAVVIGVKLWIQLGRHLGEWADAFRQSTSTVVATTVALAGFFTAAILARRMRRGPASDDDVETTKERLIYLGVLISVLPLAVSLLALGAQFLVFQFGSVAAGEFLGEVNTVAGDLVDWIRTVAFGAVLAAGAAMLIRKPATETSRQLALGLLLLGAFNFPFYLLILMNDPIAISLSMMDVLATLVLAVVLLARWRSFDSYGAATMVGVVVFLWLAGTKGDFIGIAGGLLGLASVVVVVFGIVYTLLADSSLASGHGRWLPRDARVLLWIGYLVLSVAILNWITATHATDLSASNAARAFADIGVPLAVWLIIRRPWTPREAEMAALPQEELDPGVDRGA